MIIYLGVFDVTNLLSCYIYDIWETDARGTAAISA